MFFKRKPYRSIGEMIAIELAKHYTPDELLRDTQNLVTRQMERMPVGEASKKQKEQLCRLAIEFHNNNVSFQNNRHMIRELSDQILTDFRKE